MNQIILTGRLTKDIEIKVTSSNKHVMSNTIAVRRGTKEEKTDFVNFDAWGHNADYLNDYASKGTMIGLIGQLRVDEFDTESGRKKKIFVNADRVEILSRPKSKEEKAEGKNYSVEEQNKQFTESILNTEYEKHFGANVDLSPDDLPFY